MSQHPQPNVVMLVADDHESRAMHWRGCADVETPNLDRLAAGGTAFTRAYQMGGHDGAVCIPTRASLLTGMNHFNSMRGERGGIDPDRVTLPERFKQAGYHCYVTGKWHNDNASLARSFSDGSAIFTEGMHDHYSTPVHPFDPTGVFPEHKVATSDNFSVDVFADTACSFIGDYDNPAPFFLYAAFTAPHDPRTPPSDFLDRYSPSQLTLPQNFAAEHPFDLGVHDIRDERLAPYPRTPERIRKELADYYGMITAMDDGIGRIIQALKNAGALDNTIIVYTGDHGLAMGQHGLLGKQNVYEHSARVPLIFHGPGVPVDQVSKALAYTWDSYPTLCDLCGISTPDDLDARSLTPIMDHPGTAGSHRETVTTLYMDSQRMIAEDRWKLIVTNVNGAEHMQLFDLQNDPFETNNLIDLPECAPHRQRLYNLLEKSPAGLPKPV